MKKYNLIYIYILMFLGIFFPYINISSVVFPTLVIGFFLPATLCLCRYKLNKDLFFYLIFLCITLGTVYFIASIKGSEYSVRLLTLSIVLFFILYSAKYLVFEGIRSGVGQLGLYNIIINTVLFNSIFIILISLNLIDFTVFYSFIHTNPLVFTYPIPRYPGFAYDAFSYVSVLNAFALCLLLDCFFSKKINFNMIFSLKVTLLFVSLILSGRAGIVVVIIYFLFQLIKFEKRIIYFLIISFCILVFSYFINWGDYEWLKLWAFGFIINIVTGANAVDSSVSGVQSMILLPDNIWVGDSYDFLSVPSDLGFVRAFVSLGLFGIGIFGLFFGYLLYLSIKCKSSFGIFMVCSFLFLNFKDVYFIAPYGHFFMFFCIIYIENYKVNSSNKRTKYVESTG